jgi:Holliday junction resolvasome RuvABC endonuclease subunit
MMARRKHNLVLGIYPDSRGFAYVLFEGPLAPRAWRTSDVRGDHRVRICVARISAVFGEYGPDAVVLQDMSANGTSRACQIRAINDAVSLLAETQGIATFTYSRADVRACFAPIGAITKDGIVEAIIKRIPAFERLRPPVRKLWTNEHPRMALFDAAALVITHFCKMDLEQGGKSR